MNKKTKDTSNELTKISSFNEDGPIIITKKNSIKDINDPYDFGNMTQKYLENDKFIAK